MCFLIALFLGITSLLMGAERASWMTIPLMIVYHNHKPSDMPSALIVVAPLFVILTGLRWSVFSS